MIDQEHIQSGTVASSPSRRILLGVASAFLLMLAVYAHIQITRIGDDYTGLLAPLDRLFDISLALGILIVAFVTGWTVCRMFALEFANSTEEISISALLGTGIVGTLVLGLALAGLLTPLPVTLLLATLIYISRKGFVRLMAIIDQERARIFEDRSHRIIFALFLLLIALLTLRALTPPSSPDEAIYHLPVTREFVKHGKIFPVYDNFSGNMPFLIHMNYALCLMAKSDIAARIFSLFLGIITAFAVHGFCARFLTRRAAIFALFIFFASGMVIEVGITTRVDLSLAGILFAVFYAMSIYLESGKRGWLYVMSMLAGFGLAVKYTAGAWLFILGLILIADSLLIKRERVWTVFKDCLVYSVIAIALASPWLIKNQIWFENAIYPYITGEVAAYDNGKIRYFNQEDERRLEAHLEAARNESASTYVRLGQLMASEARRRPQRHPFRFWEYFTDPDRYNIGEAEKGHSPNYLFIFAPMALLLPRRRWTIWLFATSVLFYLFVASTAWVARYFLPVYPCLTVLAAYGLAELGYRFRQRTALAVNLFVFIAAISVVSASSSVISKIQSAKTVGFVTGVDSRHQFMTNVFYYHFLDYTNRNTPPDARVMMMGFQMAYDLKRDYLDEAGWDSIEWRRILIRNSSLEDVARDLKGQGITHILYSSSLFKFVAFLGREGSGPSGSVFGDKESFDQSRIDYDVQLKNWMTFEIFKRKFTDVEYQIGEWYLLRLK